MTLRLVTWNVENATRWLVPGALAARVAALGEPDVVCLQEVRVRASDAAAIAQLRAALPGYTCDASLNRDPRNATFRGGRAHGVATFVREALGARGEVPAWDREGRCVVSRLCGGLAIGNVYAVNGTSKPYLDPDTGAPRGDRHAFKRAFQAQVFAHARALRATGPVVLAGDWNVTRTARDTHPRLRTEEPHAGTRAAFEAELAGTGPDDAWTDSWRALHPEARGYTWFNPRARGLDAARVDYVLVSRDVAVASAEILDAVADRPGSDHAPIAVALRTG